MILHLVTPGMSTGRTGLFSKYAHTSGLSNFQVQQACLTAGCMEKLSKRKWRADPAKRAQFWSRLTAHNPQFILINCPVALDYISNGRFQSLANTRGSILPINRPNGGVLYGLVIDDVLKVKQLKYYPWIYRADLKKAVRWLTGNVRAEPRFDYRVAENPADLHALLNLMSNGIASSIDIETSGVAERAAITSIGYSVLTADGRIPTWVIPFCNPTRPNNLHFGDKTAEVLSLVAQANDLPIPKVMQNGTYDSHYLIRARAPVRNYVLDPAHIFHSLWPESPKRIDWIASFCCDYYYYWKDEGKEEMKDDNKGEIKIPLDEAGLTRYWRYNGLDCHYTLLAARFLTHVLSQPGTEWALENYRQEFRAVVGPGFGMSMRGVRIDEEVQATLAERNAAESATAMSSLRTMVADEEFNPNSVPEKQSLIYSVLRASPIKRKGKSTDQKVLALIQTQGPILDLIIQGIWDVTKPANNYSKYAPGNLRAWNGERWMYKMNPAGTETGRYASKASDFWCGTNIQNVPEPMRVMVEADPGYMMFKADYSASDSWFMAYESQTQDMIDVLNSDRDFHCHHAAQFFNIPYEKILEGYKEKAEWVVDAIIGVRQNQKRISHGSNYLMAGFTLFLHMGKKAVVATAKAMGHQDVDGWNLNQFINFCQGLIDYYYQEMYPELGPWLTEELQRAARNGNRATAFGGRTRTFFSNLLTDKAAQREFAAYFGQGGTAGNINRAIDTIWYDSDFEAQGGMLLFQVHDDITGQVPLGRFDLMDAIKTIMESSCEVRGRSFTIPVELSVGLGWGARMIDYKQGVTTLDDVRNHERHWRREFFADSEVQAA